MVENSRTGPACRLSLVVRASLGGNAKPNDLQSRPSHWGSKQASLVALFLVHLLFVPYTRLELLLGWSAQCLKTASDPGPGIKVRAPVMWVENVADRQTADCGSADVIAGRLPAKQALSSGEAGSMCYASVLLTPPVLYHAPSFTREAPHADVLATESSDFILAFIRVFSDLFGRTDVYFPFTLESCSPTPNRFGPISTILLPFPTHFGIFRRFAFAFARRRPIGIQKRFKFRMLQHENQNTATDILPPLSLPACNLMSVRPPFCPAVLVHRPTCDKHGLENRCSSLTLRLCSFFPPTEPQPRCTSSTQGWSTSIINTSRQRAAAATTGRAS